MLALERHELNEQSKKREHRAEDHDEQHGDAAFALDACLALDALDFRSRHLDGYQDEIEKAADIPARQDTWNPILDGGKERDGHADEEREHETLLRSDVPDDGRDWRGFGCRLLRLRLAALCHVTC